MLIYTIDSLPVLTNLISGQSRQSGFEFYSVLKIFFAAFAGYSAIHAANFDKPGFYHADKPALNLPWSAVA